MERKENDICGSVLDKRERKLFGYLRFGMVQTFWKKAVSKPDVFFQVLLRAVAISEGDLSNHIKEMRTYRDKFVTHLDSDEVMQIPDLTITLKTVSFLYDYILDNEGASEFFSDATRPASAFYKRFLEEGKRAYAS